MEWTRAQEDAIASKGNVIVTAAAGSGKTAVLVERVIKCLCDDDNPVSADRLLVVTFTNAAAAEMRQRIEKALADRCTKEPNNARLLEQRLLLPSADICTIDSFCIRLVRNNFAALGVSPDFKIADEVTAEKIKSKVLTKIFSEYLKNNDEDFIKFLNAIGSEYGTENAETTIKKTVDFAEKLPQCEKWIESLAENYNPENTDNSPWLKAYFNPIIEKITWVINNLSKCRMSVATHEATDLKFGDALGEAIEFSKVILPILKENNWDELYEKLKFAPGFIGKFTYSAKYDRELFDMVKNAYSAYKETVQALIKDVSMPLEQLKKEFEFCYDITSKVSEVSLKYYKKSYEALNKKGLLTFSMVEQLALKLLTNTDLQEEFSNENFSQRLKNAYDIIMVDEYQDINDLQGAIFDILSNNGENLFTVGDVKQSIYGFRGSNPNIFLKRSENAEQYSKELSSSILKRVVLSKNFRSKKGICEFVNGFFATIMSKECGGIVYDEFEKLNPADEGEESVPPPVEAHFISSEDLGEVSTEAEFLADYIEKTMQSNSEVNYSDFAVLYRSGTNLSIYANALKKRNIPVDLGTGAFFETTEIMTAVSLIKAVENPMRDISMLSVMLSPIFGFNETDVALLKLKNPNKKLYSSAIVLAGNGNSKCSFLVKKISFWRKKAATMSTADFVSFLLNDSGYYNMILSMSDKERRHANLILLENIAESYFNESAGDISGFVNHLNFLEKNSNLPSASVSNNNSVCFTTMHKSKGLQFPITIIVGCSGMFSRGDSRENVLYDEKLGFAFKYVDDVENKIESTFSLKILNNIYKSKRIDEELRLLYVAMTRAKEKLVFLFGVNGDFSKKAETWTNFINQYLKDDETLDSLAVSGVSGVYGWLIPAFLLTKNGRKMVSDLGLDTPKISKHLIETDVLVEYKTLEIKSDSISNEQIIDKADNQLTEKIKEIFEYNYPFAKLNEIEIKTSVSELTKRNAENDFVASARPAFITGEGLNSVERGNALHKFMQFAEFNRITDNLSEEIERLYEYEFLTQREVESLEQDKIKAFVNSSLFKRILNADKVFKEQRFLMNVNASDIYPEVSGLAEEQTVIVQGAVDCLFIEDNHIVLLDFKTDKVNDENKLLNYYSEQLKTYCKAAEKMFSLPVNECYIYSLNMGKEIKVLL